MRMLIGKSSIALRSPLIAVGGWSPPASLEAQWTFNNTPNDNSGNSRNLTENGTITYSDTVKQLGTHSAGEFDGSTDYLSIADANAGWMDTLLGQDFTIEFWVRFTSIAADRVIFFKRVLGGAGVSIFCDDSNNKIKAVIYQNASNTHKVKITNALSTNTWYHIAVVRDISQGASQQLKIYVNGTDETVAITTTGNPQDCSNSADIKIGTNSINWHYGYLDCMRVWNDVRTQSEISNNKDTEEPS